MLRLWWEVCGFRDIPVSECTWEWGQKGTCTFYQPGAESQNEIQLRGNVWDS